MAGIKGAFAQDFYEVKKVCYGSPNSAMVVEYQNRYFVITSSRVLLTKSMLITDIPSINFGGNSIMTFANSPGGSSFGYVNVVASGHPAYVNNRWQRFFYSGLPGAKSICRQIAFGY